MRFSFYFVLGTGLVVAACQTPKPLPVAGGVAVTPVAAAPAAAPVWQSAAYTIYPDRVVQGPFEARALSATELTSNYRSPASETLSPQITFKFSLNGKDNESAPGQDHQFLALPAPGGGALETPVIAFGRRFVDARPVPANTFLAPNTAVKIRLDMRAVLAAFQKPGFFTTYNGDKIYRADFKGVYVAGNVAPLSWEFDNLPGKPGLQLTDPDQDGIYETTLTFNQPGQADAPATSWQKTLNTDDLPQYSSDYPLADALYNLALEEARRAVEPDSTFRTGKVWAGVWTRDISYSIILSQATLQPLVAMKSLLRKVRNGRIVQDTGTGGAYPVSSDRVIWAVAAWEIYCATGDKAWLAQVYPIVRQTLADDWQNLYDPATQLLRGESSFLDWREQTYPRWMQPADIYQSECLGTNAVHFQARVVAARMATVLYPPAGAKTSTAAAHFLSEAGIIQYGINTQLWQEQPGYYGQYRYGRLHPVLSPRAEALGEALCVIFGVADGDEGEQARRVVARTPTLPFGIPCVYPQTPGVPPYHNNAVWPFVQSFWALAGARAGNEASVAESMAAIYRPAALFLTNKENFVATTGDYAGTQINSSNMLWSLSGSLSLVYKVLFGMQFEAERLVFRPFVPQAWQGQRRLSNFRYRGAVLDVEMQGFGNEIGSITLDGQPLADAAVPGSLRGRHRVRIELKNQSSPAQAVHRANPQIGLAPDAPVLTAAGHTGVLRWNATAEKYVLFKDAAYLATTDKPGWEVPADAPGTAEYTVVAVANINGETFSSFTSEPLTLGQGRGQTLQLETLAPPATRATQGYTGRGCLEISPTQNTKISFTFRIPAAGRYALDFRYANGNGPLNTDNKCALRTLRGPRGSLLGTIVLPQRGAGEWSNWGYSNALVLDLRPGLTRLTLAYEAANENMNGAVNEALLDCARLRRLP